MPRLPILNRFALSVLAFVLKSYFGRLAVPFLIISSKHSFISVISSELTDSMSALPSGNIGSLSAGK